MAKQRERRSEKDDDDELVPPPPPAASQRMRIAVIAVAGSVAAFGVFGGFSGLGKSGTNQPYDAIPKASFIAATIDFEGVRRSPIYDVAFGKESSQGDPLRRSLGVSALGEACGFDPTTRVQRIAVSVPEEGNRGEFGVVARVDVTRDELEKCTKALADKRGGRAETHDEGSFVVLEDKSIGGASAPRLAYGRGGLLVVGKGTWFDAMLGAANRTAPGLDAAPEHVALRAALTSREGFRAPTVLVTAVLPRGLRDRLKDEMHAELGGELSNAAMAGVLSVSAVGAALNVGGPGQNVDASVELVCDSAEACQAVEKLLKKKRADWSGDLMLRMMGIGPLLDAFQVTIEGAHLRVTTTAQGDALAAALDRVMKLRGRGTAPPPSPRRPQKPDETIPARPDDASAPRGNP